MSFFSVSQLTGFFGARYGLVPGDEDRGDGLRADHGGDGRRHGLGLHSLPVMAVFLFIGYGFLGLVIPTSAVLALEEHGEIAGTASSLMGTLHFVAAAFAMVIVSLVFDGTALPMVGGYRAGRSTRLHPDAGDDRPPRRRRPS